MLDIQKARVQTYEEKAVRRVARQNLESLFVCAAVKGDITMLKMCLERGLDIKNEGYMAMRAASEKGLQDVVAFLLKEGASPEAAHYYGTPEIKHWVHAEHPVKRKMF